MSISQYVIGGLALVTALSVGWAKWNEQGAKVDKAEARTAIAKAECVTDLADDVTQSALQQVTTLTAEVARQKAIAAAEAKKSRQRLDAYNALNRKIANVPTIENVPVSSHIESVLDSVRGSVPGVEPAPGGANESGDSGAADVAGRDLSTEAVTAPEAPGS